ncbi:MAG: ABC transporter permease [Firmicutes bacterium]|nr:ABC transporter permease [Bacillota bacterium]
MLTFPVVAGVIEQGLVYSLMALGVYITFRVLDFPDLSVDGSFPLGAAVSAKLIVDGYNPFVALVVALAAGLAAGAFTGFLNTRLRISSLLAGILTMTALYSVNLRIMGRANIPLLMEPTFLTLLEKAGIPSEYVALVSFFVLVVVVKLVLDWFLHTEVGFALRATGDNPIMIRSLGVNTDRMKVFGLAISNGLVAFSGGLVAQYQGFADVGMGIGTIVTGLASVIIGEVLFHPRRVVTQVLSVIIGSMVYRLAIFLALRLGFAPTDLKLVTTVLVIIALAAPTFSRWRKQAKLLPKSAAGA